MEIIIGIVVVVVFLIVIGKLKGAPEPSAISDAAIFQRIHTETTWISKYLSQPLSSQQSASLKRMYEEKTEYVKNLKAELAKRKMAQGASAVHLWSADNRGKVRWVGEPAGLRQTMVMRANKGSQFLRHNMSIDTDPQQQAAASPRVVVCRSPSR